MTIKKDVKLQRHQERVKEKLKDSDELLLYHGLGSGKTLSAINAVDDIPTDFIVPASLRGNTKKELSKFTDSNKVDISSYNKFLKSEPTGNQALVLDEVQKINNSGTAISKKVVEASKLYKKKILLSGGPIRNFPSDLGPILQVLNPDVNIPVSKVSFDAKFIEKKKVSPGLIASLFGVTDGSEDSIKNVDKLEEMVSGKVDYRSPGTKDYPSISKKVYKTEMSPEQSNIYKKTLEDVPFSVSYKMKNNIPLSGSEKAYINSFLGAARQISNSTEAYGIDTPTPKFKLALKHLKNELATNSKGKALIYSNYLGSGVNSFGKLLDKEGITYGKFTGSVPEKKRNAMVEQYNAGKLDALVISGAGSEGLDLVGTSLVQLLDPHWNNARTDQVIGRARRFKSHAHLPKEKRKVQVKKYQSVLGKKFFGLMDADTSVDEYLHTVGEKKDALNDQFLSVLKRQGSLLPKASYMYHRTPNIEKILKSGKLKSLKSLANSNDTVISVEPNRWNRERKTISSKKALSNMTGVKAVDKIFLTKDSPIGNSSYGKYLIEKKLKKYEASDLINFIPNEHTVGSDLSVKSNTSIYVPDAEYSDLKERYSEYSIKPESKFKGSELPTSSLKSFVNKLLGFTKEGSFSSLDLETASHAKIKRMLGNNAHLVGSRGLGIGTKKADTDIFMYYKNEKALKKAILRVKKNYGLKESKFNSKDKSRTILQGPNVDVAFSSSPSGKDFLSSFYKAKNSISSEHKKNIKKHKSSLINSGFFPNTRYKNYKKHLVSKFDIKHF